MQIAITGIGMITPLGLDAASTLSALAAGSQPASAPTGPDAAAVPELMVCPIPEGFKPRDFLRRRKDLKLMAPANRLAVAAAKMAVEDAGLAEHPALDEGQVGLFLGAGREPASLDDLLPTLAHSKDAAGADISLRRLVDEGMGWMNPLSVLKTLPNMSAAHVAITLGVTGVNQAVCAGPEAGLMALGEAVAALTEGRARWAIAGAADDRTALPDRLIAARLTAAGERPSAPVGAGAAMVTLEPLEAALARGATLYGLVEIDPHAPPPSEAYDEPWGDCGAATWMLKLAVSAARRRDTALGSVTLSSPSAERLGAPAIRLLRERDAVAITAIGLRTPIGHDFDGFTEALLAGRSGHRLIQRFRVEGFPAKVACEVRGDHLSLPDPLAEAMAGLDARMGELALSAALSAVAHHGALPPESAVVYATGLSSVSCGELVQDYMPWLDDDGRLDHDAMGAHPWQPGTPRPQSPWRHLVDRPARLLRSHLGLTGPWACHFSACAAGAAAIGHGADLVRRGLAPAALVGGADSMIHPFGLMPFIRLGAATEEPDPRRAGRPFDRDRSGFVMGEGSAFFVLEPYTTARAAGRPILGVLAGWGSSLDAYNVTAPHPEGHGAAQAIRGALAAAGWGPERVQYINAHGTGTALNDVAEARAIRAVFGAGAPPVSSSKAQLGHAIAAAGAVEMAACLSAFAGGALPPNPHTDEVDPAIDLDLVGKVGRPGAPAALLSNSFGFGGQNACLALAHPEAVDVRGRLS